MIRAVDHRRLSVPDFCTRRARLWDATWRFQIPDSRFQIPDSRFQKMMASESEMFIWNLESRIWSPSSVAAEPRSNDARSGATAGFPESLPPVRPRPAACVEAGAQEIKSGKRLGEHGVQ